MQLNRDCASAKYQITKYITGCVTVNDQDYSSSILIMPDLVQPWSITTVAQLQPNVIQQLLELHPDVIIIGTGQELIFPASNLIALAQQHNVGIEIMTTIAACRTYTVLMSEQRRVLAALII